MNNSSHSVVRSGVLLGLIALLGTALLAGVNALTHERIAEQEKLRVLQQLNAVVPVDSYNNDLLEDRIEIIDETRFRHPAPVSVYRARLGDQPVAVLMIVTAPDGYNGDIRLLTAINTAGVVLGVRVLSHRETPGLGDPIEVEKSDWVLDFNGKSLLKPQLKGWTVKRDGGEFDQFTGATISPRSVVKAVHSALLYFQENQQLLFEKASIAVENNDN
jgi:electron transport complex protein RnfG